MSKNIVVCADGTGEWGLKKTNVAQLFAALDLSNREKQIACYSPGVGTIVDPEVSTLVLRSDPGVVYVCSRDPRLAISRYIRCWAGQAVGYGLFENVENLYRVLIDHYSEGDRIYLFGFSRGAFTVRVLAGLLYRCGVLLPQHRGRYREAFNLYKPHLDGLTPEALLKLKADAKDFRRRFSKPCKEISFLGVWDTVKSVGYIWPRSLPHTRRNPIVKKVRHAMSLDERRSFFLPTTWGYADGNFPAGIEDQDVREIWFAGNHADVGGGYEEEGDLAIISLRWMINEATACGLLIEKSRRQEIFAHKPEPRLKSHDELKKRGWRLSEFLPRWELNNDSSPPRRLFRWGPSGRRCIRNFARKGTLLIDSHARRFYDTAASPWSGIEGKTTVEFVETASLAPDIRLHTTP